MKKSYRDLEIYQKAVQLSTGIHNLSLKFPKFEMYEEGSQIRRASKSIAANIVEGFGRRRYKQEFIRFLFYALASCDETRAHLEMLFKTQSLKDRNDYLFFCREYDHLGRMLTNFIKTVTINHKTGI